MPNMKPEWCIVVKNEELGSSQFRPSPFAYKQGAKNDTDHNELNVTKAINMSQY